MKIRTDFVTNSSSSAFILVGMSIDDYDLKKISTKLFDAIHSDDAWDIIEGLSYGTDEEVKKLDLDGMTIIDGAEDFGSCLNVGLVNSTLEGELERKTLTEVKKQVSKKLSKVLGRDVSKEVVFHYGEIYNLTEIDREPK